VLSDASNQGLLAFLSIRPKIHYNSSGKGSGSEKELISDSLIILNTVSYHIVLIEHCYYLFLFVNPFTHSLNKKDSGCQKDITFQYEMLKPLLYALKLRKPRIK
jgi:hypothetical protein